jgi:hypothetical protein
MDIKDVVWCLDCKHLGEIECDGTWCFQKCEVGMTDEELYDEDIEALRVCNKHEKRGDD